MPGLEFNIFYKFILDSEEIVSRDGNSQPNDLLMIVICQNLGCIKCHFKTWLEILAFKHLSLGMYTKFLVLDIFDWLLLMTDSNSVGSAKLYPSKLFIMFWLILKYNLEVFNNHWIFTIYFKSWRLVMGQWLIATISLQNCRNWEDWTM